MVGSSHTYKFQLEKLQHIGSENSLLFLFSQNIASPYYICPPPPMFCTSVVPSQSPWGIQRLGQGLLNIVYMHHIVSPDKQLLYIIYVTEEGGGGILLIDTGLSIQMLNIFSSYLIAWNSRKIICVILIFHCFSSR